VLFDQKVIACFMRGFISRRDIFTHKIISRRGLFHAEGAGEQRVHAEGIEVHAKTLPAAAAQWSKGRKDQRS